MKTISDWLEHKLDNMGSEIGFEEDASAFEQHAELLRAEAEEAGYTAEELTEACGGDIGAFLRDRQNLATDNEMQDKLAGDPFPIPPSGLKQD